MRDPANRQLTLLVLTPPTPHSISMPGLDLQGIQLFLAGEPSGLEVVQTIWGDANGDIKVPGPFIHIRVRPSEERERLMDIVPD